MKIAINGFGRIGRNIVRAFFENNFDKHGLEIVAINDLAPIETNVHLFKYDTVHGTFQHNISVKDDVMTVNNHNIQLLSERDPQNLPWKKLGVDMVFECTGIFRDHEKASLHLKAGAQKVLISAPSPDADKMVVFGVNHEELTANDTIISNASCTTNCLAPVAKVLHEHFGLEGGLMTTIHSYTNDQSILDLAHKDLHRARAAAQNMIPTSTGAAKAVGKVLPELNGKLDGFSMRVPTPNVSVVDLTFTAQKELTVENINQAIQNASQSTFKGVLGYSDEPLVSCDFNHNPDSSIFDATQTRILEDGKMAKILTWYDNEWGFSNRMLDVAAYIKNNL